MSQPYIVFNQLFGDSLITPLRAHMAICNEAAQQLGPFFDSVIKNDRGASLRTFRHICELEHAADEQKRNIRLQLPSGMLLTVSRHELLEWVRTQDKIPNAVRDLTGLISGRAIHFPKFLHGDIRACVQQSQDTVAALAETLARLDTLVGTGFIPGRARQISAGIEQVDKLERQSDLLEHQAYQVLYQHEEEVDPVDAMFLYRVIELIGDVAGSAQSVAHRIRIVIAN